MQQLRKLGICLVGFFSLPAIACYAQLSSVSLVIKDSSVQAGSLTTSNDSICLNESVQLSVKGGYLGDGADWIWYEGDCSLGTIVGKGAAVSISPSTTTTYYCRAEGSCNNTICKDITVNLKSTDACNQLPLKLLDFQAKLYQEDKGLLTWVTADEKNTDQFLIEKSYDGVSYELLGKKLSSANSANGSFSYSYIDPALKNGYNYYRLRIVDVDGSFTFSPVRILRYDDRQMFAPVLYPNPAAGKLYFEFYSTEESTITSWVTNMLSQKIYHLRKTSVTPGKNTIEVDLQDISNGNYVFSYQLLNDAAERNIKFSKIAQY